MNEVLQCLETRQSCRSYEPNRIPSQEIIDEVLKAGEFAPSSMGLQSAKMVCVTNKAVRDQLSRMNAAIMGTTSDPFYGAPVVIVVLVRKDSPNPICDGSLVMGNLMTAAHALGLGSCWIHRAKEEFDSEEGKALLRQWGIEGDYVGVGHCVLGYASKPYPTRKPRKPDYITYVK
jgi:nitroreductase